MYSKIYSKILNKESLCFVRINDGEASTIMYNTATPSRGDETYSELLSIKLNNIITDDNNDESLFIGIPCYNCYGKEYRHVLGELTKSKSQEFITNNVVDANCLINNNYDSTLNVLMSALKTTKNILIINETGRENVENFHTKIFPVFSVHTVTSKNAFNNCYENFKDLTFSPGSVIITLCGPLGRVLCYEWYCKNKSNIYLDLGSFFDPILRKKSYLYHTNNHKYCINCYPNFKLGYSEIFNYCEKVEKECYYLLSLRDHNSLYNNNKKGILNNLSVRKEKEPNNISIRHMITTCKLETMLKNIDTPSEGYSGQISEQYYDLINLCHRINPKRILEIGFLCGSSSLLFLENTNAYVTSIDIKKERYTEDAYEYLLSKYPDRLELIIGDSNNIVPTLQGVFDIILIDGSHDYDGVLADFINCHKKATSSTLVIMDDVILNKLEYETNWTVYPSKIIKEYIDKKVINIVYSREYTIGRGMVAFNYNMNMIPTHESVYIEITNILYDKLVDDNNCRLTNKILTYLLELRLLKSFKLNNLEMSNEGYIFQIPEMFEDIIDLCNARDPERILEIGFLHGSSSLLFLMNTTAYVTSIDITKTPTTCFAEEEFEKYFNDRFTLIHGSSDIVMPNLVEKYDIIFLDGSHDLTMAIHDINNAMKLLNDNGLIIMNDVVTNEEYSMFWNKTPTDIFNQLVQNDIINSIKTKNYCQGRGIAAFTLKKKNFWLQ